MTSKPIGVFDSGIGGISVLQKIRKQMPCEDLICVADSCHAPYGSKSLDVIKDRCIAITQFLLSHHIKAMVVACNTATAAAVACLRQQFSLPIIAMEPGLKPAANQTKSGKVGILATASTIDSSKFNLLQNQFNHHIEIITQACPGLVEMIEQPDATKEELTGLLRGYIAPLVAQGVDALVLGCTHYPLLIAEIEVLAGAGVNVIDTGDAVAKELLRQLGLRQWLRQAHRGGQRFFCNGDLHRQALLLAKYWGESNLLLEPLPQRFQGKS